MNTLRLTCPCGRNLADVTKPIGNPMWTPDGLVVGARPNVTMSDFRPHQDRDPARRGSGLTTAHTYTWHCRCGQTHSRRHARIGAKWLEHSPADAPMVTLVLGVDL